MKKPTITIGCDPEIFVKQHGSFVSAHGLIPGNKQTPHKVEKGAVQVDGMALEFNIDPARSEKEFVGNVQHVLSILKSMVPGYELAAVPVADFSLEYIASQPREARELGCDPDFDAYTGQANLKPNAELPMRTASGHVHIGWTDGAVIYDDAHQNACRAVSQQLDVVLGIGSLFYDDDQRRRSMYGNPGCYRAKPYGAEYRTLSNAWLLTEDRMAWVFRNTKKAMEMLFNGKALFEDAMAKEAPAIIRSGDKEKAMVLVNHFGLELVK